MIGKILKTMRHYAKLKQTDITKITGIPQNTLSQYENGIIQPTFEIIDKIAKACNFEISFTKGDITLTPENIDRKEI